MDEWMGGWIDGMGGWMDGSDRWIDGWDEGCHCTCQPHDGISTAVTSQLHGCLRSRLRSSS